jgi:uncharacterized damage-inducible protein DinB
VLLQLQESAAHGSKRQPVRAAPDSEYFRPVSQRKSTDEGAIMSARAEALAAEFDKVNGELIDAVNAMSDEQWRARCDAEGWTVGVTAHHVAGGYGPISGLVQAIATGQPLPPLTPEMIDQGNAEHAKQAANCTKAETIELLRSGGASGTAIVRGLSDEQLGRSATVFGNQITAEQAIQQILIGHPQSHLDSIRKAG